MADLIPFGEYRPDVADYEGQHTLIATNVVPQADGYGPWFTLKNPSTALSAACRGAFYAVDSSGNGVIFAGTSNKLFVTKNLGLTWTDASKGSSTYTALATNKQWKFAQFNNFVIATQDQISVPQVYDLTSSTNFADLGGSPPSAAYVTVVNRFLVLSGLPANPYRVQWSGLNALTTWDNVSAQSNFQDMADNGVVYGVAGGEFGTIFQARSIRRMTYAPGSPVIFTFERITRDDGCIFPNSITQAADRLFYYSPQGFKSLIPGGLPQSIGKEKVDRTFNTDRDQNTAQLIIGSGDPRSNRVYWAYRQSSTTAGLLSKIMVYDWMLDRWSLVIPDLNLETLTVLADGVNVPVLSAFTSNHQFAYFGGYPFDKTNTLGANLETAQRSDDAQNRRLFVRGFRPVTDVTLASTEFAGYLTYRERLTDTMLATANSSANAQGYVWTRKAARYFRAGVSLSTGVTWTFASGVVPDYGIEGMR